MTGLVTAVLALVAIVGVWTLGQAEASPGALQVLFFVVVIAMAGLLLAAPRQARLRISKSDDVRRRLNRLESLWRRPVGDGKTTHPRRGPIPTHRNTKAAGGFPHGGLSHSPMS